MNSTKTRPASAPGDPLAAAYALARRLHRRLTPRRAVSVQPEIADLGRRARRHRAALGSARRGNGRGHPLVARPFASFAAKIGEATENARFLDPEIRARVAALHFTTSLRALRGIEDFAAQMGLDVRRESLRLLERLGALASVCADGSSMLAAPRRPVSRPARAASQA